MPLENFSYNNVSGWSSTQLGNAAESIRVNIDDLEEARTIFDAQPLPISGAVAEPAAATKLELSNRIDQIIEDKRRLMQGLLAAEEDVAEIEKLVDELASRAFGWDFVIDNGTPRDKLVPPAIFTPLDEYFWRQGRNEYADLLVADVENIMAKAAAADAALAARIPEGTNWFTELAGTPDPEVAAAWELMTEEERVAAVEALVLQLAEEAGIDAPQIVWDPAVDSGQFLSENGQILLNPSILSSPYALATAAHELRHAQQYAAANDYDAWHWPWDPDPFAVHANNGITPAEAEAWGDSFDNYIEPGVDGATYEDYATQPIEEDAFEAGEEYLDELTVEELEELMEG